MLGRQAAAQLAQLAQQLGRDPGEQVPAARAAGRAQQPRQAVPVAPGGEFLAGGLAGLRVGAGVGRVHIDGPQLRDQGAGDRDHLGPLGGQAARLGPAGGRAGTVVVRCDQHERCREGSTLQRVEPGRAVPGRGECGRRNVVRPRVVRGQS